MTRPEISTVARRGSSSAARAVTGAFSHLRTGMNDRDCRSERIETDLEDELRTVAAHVPAYKETEQAHKEAADSHMFQARMAHVHHQLGDARRPPRRRLRRCLRTRRERLPVAGRRNDDRPRRNGARHPRTIEDSTPSVTSGTPRTSGDFSYDTAERLHQYD